MGQSRRFAPIMRASNSRPSPGPQTAAVELTMSHRAAELERQLWGPNATDFRLSPNGRNRRVSPIAVPPGEGPFTDPLRTHSSRIANRYFVETTAYGRASRLIMGFAQLNPSYKETT